MSSDKIFLSREEQLFLIEMLEIKEIDIAAEKFMTIMIEERANPEDMKKYLKRIMRKMKK